MDIALFQPQIPPNTGNIIRLCANTGANLHLIHPLGFAWDDKRLIRAGLDYAEFAHIQHHMDWQAFVTSVAGRRIWALTTRGKRSVFSAQFHSDDMLLFGNETKGLSQEVHEYIACEQKIRLPMQPHSRSINLSNSVAVVLYEAMRQTQLPSDPFIDC